jgi:transposase-like protein
MEQKYSEIIGTLGSASVAEVRSEFEELMRGVARTVILDVMAAEVERLCGPRYGPDPQAAHRRAGSAPGAFVYQGRTEAIQRPRVRHKSADKAGERPLRSYAAAKDESAVQEAVLRAFYGGVSSRDQKEVYPDSNHVSKSTVSRLWVNRGVQVVAEFRARDLSKEKWLALMADGISLGEDLTAVVALGITVDGRKIILDFEVGGSENYEVCKALLARIKDRGFRPVSRALLAITDGGKGLRKAIRKAFKHLVLQRCLVHKERNIRAYLSRKYHGKLAELFRVLRNAQGLEDATAALNEIRAFLETHSKKALESLEEAGEELLAFHGLNVPSTLNTTFLSTNCIENPFRNVRAKLNRVKHWRAETDQPQRWLAYALQTAEKGFRRIKGYRDLQKLHEALDRMPDTKEVPITCDPRVDKEEILV